MELVDIRMCFQVEFWYVCVLACGGHGHTEKASANEQPVGVELLDRGLNGAITNTEAERQRGL